MLLEIILSLLFLAVAGFWIWFSLRVGEKEKEPRKLLILALIMGVVAAQFAGLANGVVQFLFIAPRHGLEALSSFERSFELIEDFPIFMFFVGIFEEAAKFLAIRLTIYRSRFFDEIQDGILYFGLAGLGFGLLEDLGYIASLGAGVGLARVVLFTPFHPATAAIVGYFAARRKIKGEKGIYLWAALGAMMLLHGLHNILVFSPSSLTIPISLGIIAFLYGELYFMWKHAKEEHGKLTKVSNYLFCPWCGFKTLSPGKTCPNCTKPLPKVNN